MTTYTHEYCSPRLRYVNFKSSDDSFMYLQQVWRIDTVNESGAVISIRYEWRDVPTVDVTDAASDAEPEA